MEPFIQFKNKLNAWGVAIHALKMRTFTPHQIWTNIRTEEKKGRLQLLPSYNYGIHNNRGAKMAVFECVIIASSLGKGRAGRGRVGKRSSAAWRAAHFPSYASRCNFYFILQSIVTNLLQPSPHRENHPLSHNIAH
jgi:hypothetical protein